MATTTWILDKMHSELGFKIRHLMISNVSGSFKNFNAEVETAGTDFSTARINVSAEINSIFTNNDDRDAHLLNSDFFEVEKYPELKANQNFLELQAQLEGTENRISVERMKYNEAVQDYNTYIRSFPRNFIAGWFDFERKTPFAADAAAQKAPAVQF